MVEVNKHKLQGFEDKLNTMKKKLKTLSQTLAEIKQKDLLCKNCSHKLFHDKEQDRYFHWKRMSHLSPLCNERTKGVACLCIEPEPCAKKQEKT